MNIAHRHLLLIQPATLSLTHILRTIEQNYIALEGMGIGLFENPAAKSRALRGFLKKSPTDVLANPMGVNSTSENKTRSNLRADLGRRGP